MCVCVCVCVCECQRPNEAKLHGFYIYLNRRDIKLSYGEIIQFLS